jgi:hypothetical protein
MGAGASDDRAIMGMRRRSVKRHARPVLRYTSTRRRPAAPSPPALRRNTKRASGHWEAPLGGALGARCRERAARSGARRKQCGSGDPRGPGVRNPRATVTVGVPRTTRGKRSSPVMHCRAAPAGGSRTQPGRTRRRAARSPCRPSRDVPSSAVPDHPTAGGGYSQGVSRNPVAGPRTRCYASRASSAGTPVAQATGKPGRACDEQRDGPIGDRPMKASPGTAERFGTAEREVLTTPERE